MEENYDWDKIRNFQIVDGIGVGASPPLNDDVLVSLRNSDSKVSSNYREKELSKKLSSFPPLLVCSEGNNSMSSDGDNTGSMTKGEGLGNIDYKIGSDSQYINSAAGGGFGFAPPFGSTSLPSSVSSSRSGSMPASRSGSVSFPMSGGPISDIQQHYVVHPGLVDAPTVVNMSGMGGLENGNETSLCADIGNYDSVNGLGGNNTNCMSGSIYGFHGGSPAHFLHGNKQFSENAQCTEKDLQKKQLYSSGVVVDGSATSDKMNCSQNSTGVKGPTKARSRKARENSEEFSTSNCSFSRNYPQREGGNGCQLGSASPLNLSEDLNSIKYYEGFKLPLGDLGRKMLLKKLREIHTQNPTKMEKALTDHGLSYTRIRFASVQQLFKISYVCDVFDYALSIHCEFGRPRHRDSSKGAGSNSANSGNHVSSTGSGVASLPLSSQESPNSKRTVDSPYFHNSGFGGGGNPMYIGSQGIMEESYINNRNQRHFDLDTDSYTPETSPCGSYRSGSSTSSMSTKASSSSGSSCDLVASNAKKCLISKMEDLNSPMPGLPSNYSPSGPSKKRKTSIKSSSSYSFTPPPIPVTGSPMDVIHNQLLLGDISGNQGIGGGSLSLAGSGSLIGEPTGSSDMSNGYMIPGCKTSSGIIQNNGAHFDGNVMMLGYSGSYLGNDSSLVPPNGKFMSKSGNMIGGSVASVDGVNLSCPQSQAKFEPFSANSCYLSNDEGNEGMDPMIRSNSSASDGSQKSAKRQKTRSKKKGSNSNGVASRDLSGNCGGENASVPPTSLSSLPLNNTCIGSSGINSSNPIITSGGMGLAGFCGLSGHGQIYGQGEGDYEELYPACSDLTPFYQPDSEVPFAAGFETSSPRNGNTMSGFTVSDIGNISPYCLFIDESCTSYGHSLVTGSIVGSEDSNCNGGVPAGNNIGGGLNRSNTIDSNNSSLGSNDSEAVEDNNKDGISAACINNNDCAVNNNVTSNSNSGLFNAEIAGSLSYENPLSTSLYYYTHPFNTSTFDDYYLESTNYNGLPSQDLNSIDFYNSTDFDIDNIDVSGCTIVSI